MSRYTVAIRSILLLCLLPVAGGSALAARLLPESDQITVGSELRVQVEQTRAHVPATWRSSPVTRPPRTDLRSTQVDLYLCPGHRHSRRRFRRGARTEKDR